MTNPQALAPAGEIRRERHNRIRIGITGLAFVFVLVALAASFSGTASNEPELTADTRSEAAVGNEISAAGGEVAGPQDPLAEIGVAPGASAVDVGNAVGPDDTGVLESLEELDRPAGN